MNLSVTDLEYQLIIQALLATTIEGRYAKLMYELLNKLEEVKNGSSEES